MLDIIDTLRDLIRIPSVNPMGRDVSGSEYYEQALTEHLERLFAHLNLPYELHEVEPRRTNIIAQVDGQTPVDQSGQLIVFQAHQDTVPVEGMTIPPFEPDVREGRVYGRGSVDIKGGMAAMIAAVARLAEQRPDGMPNLVIACTVNEEHGFTGANHLTETWASGQSQLLPRRPDAIIVAEPTMLDIVVAHKGVLRWKCHTKGRACHSSQPDQGESAIYHMARVVTALEEYARDYVPNIGQHPLVGQPTISVGTITGGTSVNTVPDQATIEIDRRLLPGEDPTEAQQHVINFLSNRPSITQPPKHDKPYLATPSLSDEQNGPLADGLSQVAKSHGGSGQKIGVPYGTDAPWFARTGAPTVVFGPGSLEQAHTKDEWVAIDQLERATEIYYQFGRIGVPRNRHCADT